MGSLLTFSRDAQGAIVLLFFSRVAGADSFFFSYKAIIGPSLHSSGEWSVLFFFPSERFGWSLFFFFLD